MYLSKISLYVQGDPNATISLKVWKGTDAGTLLFSQNVASYVVDNWNEINLVNPVQIDASQELWFGYYIIHNAGYYPAGVDHGPAIQYKGDLFSGDAVSWISMSDELGIDKNWSLAAWVSPTSDGQAVTKPMVKESVSSKQDNGVLSSNITANEKKPHNF